MTYERALPDCAARETASARPFDKTRPEVLIGRYELTVVSTWEEAAGRWSRGDLEIWRTPGGKVQGSSDIDLDSLRVPGHPLDDSSADWLGSGDLASRDTLKPGLVHYWHGAYAEAHFLLAPVIQADGSQSWLEVDSLSDMGFWGRWDSDIGMITLYREGRVLPNPNGTFCATRTGEISSIEDTDSGLSEAMGAIIGGVASFYGLGVLLGGGSWLFVIPGALIGMGMGTRL